MSWMQELAETYDNCRSQIGYGAPGKRPLLPICHVTAQAHIEIVISGRGHFRRARLITEKADSTTIVPCTEGSASRAGSKPENHPLCDKLQYLAGDFTQFGGEVTSGFSKDPEEPFRNLVGTLSKWCESEFSHPKAQAVLTYVQKSTMMHDLAAHRILQVGSDGKLRSKDPALDKNVQNIFSVIDRQDSAFVRWIVEDSSDEGRVWRDLSLWKSWTNHYLSGKGETGLCLVNGDLRILSGNHPKYLRWEGDGAKLISANDTSGFTFRGRFVTDGQACGVGLEASHKAHYALSWLIDRQGYSKDGLVIVAWARSGASVPQPTDGSGDLLLRNAPPEEAPYAYTAQELAIKLKKRIAGYGKGLGPTDQIAVIALDAATKGRLALTYYRDLTGSDFLRRIEDWHATCAWLHRYRRMEATDPETGKTTPKYPPFVGAPAPDDIAETAYGSRVDDSLRKATVQRILPCIIDGQPIPRDLVVSVVRRASNRAGMDNWEWNKTLSIACALFRKLNKKEEYSMTLDSARTTRDYLYGRLLAVADSLEEWALNEANEQRQTNAARLMQRFAEHPYSTWRTIELALTPYKARLGGKAWKRLQMIDEVVAAFAPADFSNDKPLSGEFLLGYHSQREALRLARTHEGNSGQEEQQSTANSHQ